jgi:hypothetical protein
MMYVLDEQMRPVAEPDVVRWAQWYEHFDRQVGNFNLLGVNVSTVFLGLYHRFSSHGPPLLWETMIFGGRYNHEQWRYASLRSAVRGHKHAVHLALYGLLVDTLLYVPMRLFSYRAKDNHVYDTD